MLSPTPHYYEVRGRAAEIARSMGAGRVAAEHLFLAMLHDGGWPVSVLTGAGLIDVDQVEIAVVAAMSAPGYTPSVGASLPGGRTAGALGDSYIGLEHVFLEIIGDRAGLPARALAGTLPAAGLAHLGPTVWAELAFLAFGSTAAGLVLWNVATRSGDITRVSQLLYLEPVVSVAGAAVFLGELVTLIMIGGGLLILAGVAVSGTGGSKAGRQSRNDRNAERTSSINDAGCSSAAKWPPRSTSFQYRRSVNRGSAQRRDGR